VIIRASCERCSRPLADESDSGLCPVCLATGDSTEPPTLPNRAGGSTPVSNDPARVAVATRPRHGADHDGRAPTVTVPAALPADSWPKLPTAPAGYELLRRLGGGGMGDVYLARDLNAERLVAMKFLRHPGDPSAFDRFLVELRALAGVDHPGVVRVFASDFSLHPPFFTMEYVPGESLGARLVCTGPFEPAEAARLISRAARAVQAAHDAGVVHRDLKPSNILVGEDGQPKVSDFGLAKRTDRDDGLTTTSGPVGTPAYMAPEQTSRHFGAPGPRADVYGLGATLYHLITGRPPFSGSSGDLMSRLLTATPERPRAIRPEIPPALEAVVLKCLEKLPEGRYASAAEVADDLDRFLAGKKTAAPALTPLRRAWRAIRPRLAPIGLVALMLLGVFALGAAVWPDRKVAETPEEFVEKSRKELAAGRSVTLIGEKGLPKYTRWVFDTHTLGESSDDDKACHYVSPGRSLLELFPAPGINKYRLELELKHLGSPSEHCEVGVYFGYSLLPLPDATLLHSMFAVTFRDGDDETVFGAPRRPAVFGQLLFRQTPTEQGAPTRGQLADLDFEKRLWRPGPWRAIRIDSEPDLVMAYWRADSGEWIPFLDPARFAAKLPPLRGQRNRAFPGAGDMVPLWNPDAPLGLVACKASLSVRNVVLTPLP
jgi:eukaryotic-like serine/threonine-protein kinase